MVHRKILLNNMEKWKKFLSKAIDYLSRFCTPKNAELLTK